MLHLVLGVTHVCVGGMLCALCVDPPSWPELPTCWGELGAEAAIPVSTFHWEATHKCDWSQESPGISASVLSPKEHFCGGWRLCCPASLLLSSAWAVKSLSIPSLQAKSSLFLPCSLARKPMFSWASLNGFSSLLPVFHLGLFLPITLPGLLFPPACPSLWPGSPGCPGLPCHGDLTVLDAFPIPHSHSPPASSLFFLPLHSLWSLEWQALSPISFLSPASSCCSVQWIYLYRGTGFCIYSMWIVSNTAVAQCC